MATSKSTWVRAEMGAAALFGAKRRPLSGSANRADIDGDDSMHPRLFIESKLRASWSVWTLWRSVRNGALKCHKVPVLVLRQKSTVGNLLVVHSADFRAVAAEYVAAMTDEDVLAFEYRVRQLRGGDECAIG